VVRFHSLGGREDEQARQSGAVDVVLEFRDMSFDYFKGVLGASRGVRSEESLVTPQSGHVNIMPVTASGLFQT